MCFIPYGSVNCLSRNESVNKSLCACLSYSKLEQASKLADQYKEARYVDIVSLTYKNNERSRSRSNSESRSRSPIRRGPNQGNQGYPRVRCFNCNGPHVRRFCPKLKQGIMKAGAADYRRSRSPQRKVTFQTQEHEVPKEETA